MDEAVAVVAAEVAVMAAAPWIVWVAFADRAGILPVAFCNEVAVPFGIDDRKIAEGGIDELNLGSATKRCLDRRWARCCGGKRRSTPSALRCWTSC